MYIRNPTIKSSKSIKSMTEELEVMELHSTDGFYLDGIDPDVLGYVHDLIKRLTTFSLNSDARLESRDGALEVLTRILKLRTCKRNNLAKIAEALKSLIESTPHLQTDPQ